MRRKLWNLAVIISAIPVCFLVCGRAFADIIPKGIIEYFGISIVAMLITSLILLILSFIWPEKK